jgi:hypothetical protein
MQNKNFSSMELAGPLTFLPILAKLPGDPFETKKLNKLVFMISKLPIHTYL